MSYMRHPYYVYASSEETLWFHGPTIDGRMPYEVFDELVVMRLAELSPDQVRAAAVRAVERHGGNVNVDALGQLLGTPSWEEGLAGAVEEAAARREGRPFRRCGACLGKGYLAEPEAAAEEVGDGAG